MSHLLRCVAVLQVLALVFSVFCTPVVVADEPVTQFHVKIGYIGCEDGSEECPYNTLDEAFSAARSLCVGSESEILLWNEGLDDYKFYRSVAGTKPTPPMGTVIATPLLLALLVVAGFILIGLGLGLRRRQAG